MNSKAIQRANDVTRKVPANPKFANVTATIDTGAKMKGGGAVPTAQSIAKRRNELFKRVKLSTLLRLVKENEVSESVFALADNDVGGDNVSVTRAPSVTAASSAAHSVSGSVVSVVESDIGMLENPEYLLLDLREPGEFEQCHIHSSQNYPAAMIARDKYTPELFRMKSQKDKICILYHEDDRAGAPYATQLVQKGWENIYLLSGGLSDAREHYPEMLEGQMPPRSPDRPKTGASALSTAASRSGR